MSRVKIAMIGCGVTAAHHAAALQRCADVTVVACASRDPEKAGAFARRFGIARAGTVDEVLNDPRADALWVVVPVAAMADTVVAAAAAGLPMFMEKPVGLTAAETAAIVDKVRVPHMVGLNRRFYDVVGQTKALAEQHGGVRFVEVHMPEDVARLGSHHPEAVLRHWQVANSIHLIDLFRFFAGEVAAVETNNDVRGLADRGYSALLSFAGGARGLYNAQWYAPGGWRVAVYAQDLCVVLQPIEKPVAFVRGHDPRPLLPQGPDGELKAGFHGQARAFADLVLGKGRAGAGADLADYLRSVQLVERLTQAP